MGLVVGRDTDENINARQDKTTYMLLMYVVSACSACLTRPRAVMHCHGNDSVQHDNIKYKS